MATFTKLDNTGNLTLDNSSTFDEVTFPGGSISFNGSSQYLSVAHNDAFNLGSGDFTLECWVYLTRYSPGYGSGGTVFKAELISKDANAASSRAFNFELVGTASSWTQISLTLFQTNTTLTTTTQNYTFSLNTWYHVAAVRSSGTVTFYVNGVSIGGGSNPTTVQTTTTSVTIGYENYITSSDFSYYFPGYMTNIRIVKGTAVYTSDFTLPTAPLEPITNTSLLLSATTSSTLLTDSSINNFTVTNNGTATFSSGNPFTANNGSISFNGSSQYLSLSANSAFTFGTGDFTLETWVYPTATPLSSPTASTVKAIYGYRSGNDTSPYLLWANTGGIKFGGDVSDYVISNQQLAQNAWSHLAVTRSGNTVTLFINGTVVATNTSVTQNFSEAANPRYIGFFNGTNGYYWPGYMSNFRIVKGTAVYTSNFTPSDAPLTNIANTSLLLKTISTPNNSSFVDYSNNAFTVTSVGSPTYSALTPLTSTIYSSTARSLSPYNGGSMSFASASGRYLYPSIAANTVSNFGTNNFTIEFWCYPKVTTEQFIYDSRPATTQGKYPTIKINPTTGTTNNFLYYTNVGASQISVTGTTNIVANTWYHVAVSRNESNTRLFVNGVQEGNTATDTTNYLSGANRPLIGGYGYTAGSFGFDGFISNLRVLNGTAAYTANFTPSTEPLKNIANTTLLLRSSTSSTLLTDSKLTSLANNVFDITNNNGVSFSSVSPFAPGNGYQINSGGSGFDEYSITEGKYAAVFNGTTKYLNTPTSSEFDFGTNDFTIELWAYKNTSSADDIVITNRSLLSGALPGRWYIDNYLSKIRMVFQNTASTDHEVTNAGSINFPVGSWFHIAAVKSGSTITGYLNGVSFGTVSVSGSFGTSASGIYIGSFTNDSTWSWNGNVSNVRIVKGRALYTSNFAPSFPLLKIKNTSLLTCQSSTFIDNSDNNFTITNGGSTTITQTGLSPKLAESLVADGSYYCSGTLNEVDYAEPFSGSLNFNGSNNYLTVPATANLGGFGTGNFTIEFWTWLRATGARRDFIDMGDSSVSGPLIYYDGSNITYYFGSAKIVGSSLTANTKLHVALCRSSGSSRLFVNGLQVGGTAADVTGYTGVSATPVHIGRNQGVAGYLNGYISNLRVLKGTALYTANFTPSSTTLTNVPNTSLLLTVSSDINYITDTSNNNLTVTNVNGVTYTPTLTPFA